MQENLVKKGTFYTEILTGEILGVLSLVKIQMDGKIIQGVECLDEKQERVVRTIRDFRQNFKEI